MHASTTLGARATLALALALPWAGCGGDGAPDTNGDVIRIGTFIREDINGADEVLAAREINAAGGVRIGAKDYELEIVRVLQGDTPASAVKAVESLVARGCSAALGPQWSSVTLGEKSDHSDGAAQAAFDRGLLLISGFASSAAISDLDDDDMMWRTIGSDDFQGSAGAKFAFERQGARRASVLYRDDPWGRGLSATFVAAFRALGGEVLVEVPYDPDRDLDRYAFPELSQVFADAPDSIYIVAFSEISQISNRIVQGGHLEDGANESLQFIAADGSNTGEILTNAAPQVLRRLSGTAPGVRPDDVNFGRFADAYVAAGFGPRDDVWPFNYDAVYLLALAMQAVGSTDPREFREALGPVSRDGGDDLEVVPGGWAEAKAALLAGREVNYTGASGPIDFNENGDPGRGYYSLWRIAEDEHGAFYFDRFDSVEYTAD